jgi:hypothetical protein
MRQFILHDEYVIGSKKLRRSISVCLPSRHPDEATVDAVPIEIVDQSPAECIISHRSCHGGFHTGFGLRNRLIVALAAAFRLAGEEIITR